jgi:hypothetical protein
VLGALFFVRSISTGSLAIFAAIRRASSRVSIFDLDQATPVQCMLTFLDDLGASSVFARFMSIGPAGCNENPHTGCPLYDYARYSVVYEQGLQEWLSLVVR